ncbi:sigma-54-dependent Fis family transcriptional regulator [Candidatus Ozemobacteraceae bacterium]|nr:sigma-54-dependent Fis family transcriptional regulator [Candidatus Ozemobacteraceae bacterium]
MNILVVDDNRSLVKGLCTFLTQEGHAAVPVGTLAEARSEIAARPFDLVITDLKLPDGEGLEVIRAAREAEKPAEVILMTAFSTIETAVAAMKLGALDYLIKPVPLEEFAFRIARVAERRQSAEQADTLRRANDAWRAIEGLEDPLAAMVGESDGMKTVKGLIRKAAAFPSTVLLCGETGTGKEVAARAIHGLSPWAEGPFVRVNCASIPATLFESELFGHEKGAFTDAREKRIGRFEAARGGTLFLDEVGEVPLELQSKLLRALQEKEVIRVGGSKPIRIETRIVAATNRDLDTMAARGEFREDLLYRLAVVRITMPPLRDRPDDIPLLLEHLLGQFRREFGRPGLRLDPALLPMLQTHRWRGNIRELRNAVERAAVMAETDLMAPRDFGIAPPGPGMPLPERFSPHSVPSIAGLTESLEAVERRMILDALERSGGVKSRAAEELKIPRTNLLYRMKRLGIAGSDENHA